jgi:hypothetical protein
MIIAPFLIIGGNSFLFRIHMGANLLAAGWIVGVDFSQLSWRFSVRLGQVPLAAAARTPSQRASARCRWFPF